MLGRGAGALLGALLLAGCATERNATDHAVVAQTAEPPKRGHSRIVVLQEHRVGICACDVKLDGAPIGKVVAGTYAHADRPAGRHQLVASEPMFPGETKHDFSTESGRTYYFLVRSSERHDAVFGVGIVGGVAGMLVASAVTSGNANPGPGEFLPLDETTARTMLARLRQAT